MKRVLPSSGHRPSETSLLESLEHVLSVHVTDTKHSGHDSCTHPGATGNEAQRETLRLRQETDPVRPSRFEQMLRDRVFES